MDFLKMMGQVKEMQSKLQERMQLAQENLAKITATAESGAGLVKVQVNGHRQIVGLSIDPSLLSIENKAVLQDLVMGAVNKAIEEIEPAIKAEMQKTTEGLLPNIPGLDLKL